MILVLCSKSLVAPKYGIHLFHVLSVVTVGNGAVRLTTSSEVKSIKPGRIRKSLAREKSGDRGQGMAADSKYVNGGQSEAP